ncbi:hypothetical protein BGW42_006672, partial [Actinomortierella wolfii]
MVDKHQKVNPNGYPEEKHPQVYVDMCGSEEEQPLLPSYSATAEQPCTSEKQPLDNPPRSPCSLRERWRARCAHRCERRRQFRERFHSKCRVLRKIFLVLFITFLFLAIFGDPDDFNCDYFRTKDKNPSTTDPMSPLKTLTDDVFTDASTNPKCFDDLIPYTGPSKFTAEVPNLSVKIGEGHIVATAVVRVGDVEDVTVEFKANVTQNFKEDDGDDDDDDEEVKKKWKKHKKKHHPHDPEYKHGFHVDVKTDDEKIDVTIWADKFVPREDDDDFRDYHKKSKKHHRHRHGRHGDHPDHEHDPHFRRFCATVALEITVPESYKKFGSLNLNGVILKAQAENLRTVRFDEVGIRSVVGDITVSPVRADALEVATINGNVLVESVEAATKGHSVNAKAAVTAGNIKLNAQTSDVTAPDDDEDSEVQTHVIDAAVVAGDVEVTVAPKNHDGGNSILRETVSGDVHVRAVTTSGRAQTSVQLANNQELTLASHSLSGSAHATVSDNYLGHFSLRTMFGSTTLNEKEGSASKIVYEKNFKSIKTGVKVEDDSEESQHDSSDISLSSTTGS